VDNLDPDDVYLSVITVGEIIKGIEKLPDSRRKTELRDWLQDDLMARFHGNILPLDTDVIVEWGVLTARQAGNPAAIDSLIAATLLAHKMTLITRNVSDFEAAGIEIINPWIESGQQ
jgi:predicted nucleic acid-binding protein